MLAYAANRPLAGRRQSSPNALLLIISAHVALAAVVMSAKMDLVHRIDRGPELIPLRLDPAPPPPNVPRPTPRFTTKTPISNVDPVIKTAPTSPDLTPDPGPSQPGNVIGDMGTATLPKLPPLTFPPVHHDVRLLTPPSELRPPYPASKLASEEEAVLNLRLTIDADGRVTGVESIGRADRVFVEAARRHLVAHWRYAPATDDGHAVAATTTITLKFQLDG